MCRESKTTAPTVLSVLTCVMVVFLDRRKKNKVGTTESVLGKRRWEGGLSREIVRWDQGMGKELKTTKLSKATKQHSLDKRRKQGEDRQGVLPVKPTLSISLHFFCREIFTSCCLSDFFS